MKLQFKKKSSLEQTNQQPVTTNSTVEQQPNVFVMPTRKTHKKTVTIIGSIVAIVAVAIAAYLITKDPASNTTTKGNTQQSVTVKPEEGSVFCVKVGINSLQCENLDIKELKKYNLPDTLGDQGHMLPSPDGKKYFVTTRQNTENSGSVETFSINDAALKKIATVSTRASDETKSVPDRVRWINNDELMYIKTGYDTTSTPIYIYDTKNTKETMLVELSANIERIMPTKDKKYVYGIEAQVDTAQNATVRRLVVINTETKEITPVENDLADTDVSSICIQS